MRVQKLQNSDVGLPDNVPNVRGREVRTLDNERIGIVEDMLVDQGGHPIYLDVRRGLARTHLLVPVEYTHLTDGGNALALEGVSADRLDAWPAYDGDPRSVTPAYESRLHRFFGRTASIERPLRFGPGIERDVRRTAELDRETPVTREVEGPKLGFDDAEVRTTARPMPFRDEGLRADDRS